MFSYVETMLPDNKYTDELLYFLEHPDKLERLNNREFVVVPIEVYNVIRAQVIAIIRNYYIENPEKKEEVLPELPKEVEVAEPEEAQSEPDVVVKPKRLRAKKVVVEDSSTEG